MPNEEFQYKQVIAVRTDLKMGKGKIAAQVGHAAVSAGEKTRKKHPDWWRQWMKEGQCKVIVKLKDLDEVLELQEKVTQSGIPYSLIIDRGLTQLHPNTITCLGVGPALSEKIDKITRNLPLL